MLVNNVFLQTKALEGKYAIGAFNTNNLETTKAILNAAKIKSSPVIFAATPSAFSYAGAKYLSQMVHSASEEVDLPISLHLDHGLDLSDIVTALRNGFTSVMVDGSKLAFEQNVALTKQVVEIAHTIDISVEGELGKLVGTENQVSVTGREAAMTNPRDAKTFVEQTGIDILAVSIGNAHGWYKGKPQLDFERLKAIKDKVDVPLVLHGASGIPGDDIRRAIDLGITKINIDTEIRDAFKKGVCFFLEEHPDIFDPRKILKPAIEKMQKTVEGKIDLFGSAGKL